MFCRLLLRNNRIMGRKAYNDIVKENEKFIAYYKKQNVCPEGEFDKFITALKTDLPASFRITGSKGEAKRMLEIIQGQFIQECLNVDEQKEETKIYPLPWYPNNLAWQLDLTRKDIRRSEAYHKLHNFLISETENGTISRQETVSMIPPLLLNIEPHHKVLDMCAAPGSKTAQLLEMLHAKDDAIPSGYVVANDIDNKRCYMLVHQAKRLNSPCVAIINHDSALLPNMSSTSLDGSVQQIQFDRILCDVPCSGDGTLRKNPDIWMKWTPANGLNLHGVQSRILRRGAELLAVGGRLVYSTCSLNPLENEAVIHRILAETDGALQLVDVSNHLQGLVCSPGMKTWLVGSRNLEFYTSFDEVDVKWKTTIRPEMFPPKKEDESKYNLHRCVRILPHQQNTGGFFVAVIEKVKPLTKKEVENANKIFDNEETSESTQNSEPSRSGKRGHSNPPQQSHRKRRKGGAVFREDPFIFFNDNEEVWSSIKDFYKISDDFDSKCLLTRCHQGKKKNIYLTSSAIRDLVMSNQDTIKFINMGVKSFVRCDNKNMSCAFRIANDGLSSVYPFIGKDRIVNIPKEDLVVLLLNDNPQNSPKITSLSENVQKQVTPLSPGSCVLVYKEENVDSEEPLVIYLSGWRGTTSLRCYLTQHSTVHILRLLGEDVSKYIVNKFKVKTDEADGTEADAVEEKEEEETNK